MPHPDDPRQVREEPSSAHGAQGIELRQRANARVATLRAAQNDARTPETAG
jgi:hypothetical protein